MKTMNVTIQANGEVKFIYDDALLFLKSLGKLSISRASFVEPNAEGLWDADLSPVGGPVLKGFTKRSEALAAEVAWLEANVLRVGVSK